MDLPWRVHGLGDKRVRASVIELALNPVHLFLFVKPGLRKRVWTKGAPALLEEFDHCESVNALRAFDPKPREDSGEERSG